MEYRNEQLVECPLASVLILTYNQENLIGQTIDSILAQETTFPFEIILVDDCSPDGTKAVCLEYYHTYSDRILFIANDVNKGIKRNYFESLCTYARGKYIAICGGDDWWEDKQKLQKQVVFLEQNRDYDLVHTKARVYLEKSHRYLTKTIGYDRNLFEKMIVNNGIAALTTCFSRDAFMEYVREMDPVNMDIPTDDYATWIWFSFRKKIHLLEDITSVYRILPESASNSALPEKRFIIEKDRIDIKMFFYRYFHLSDPGILYRIQLRYFLDVMSITPLLGNKEHEKERDSFWLDHKLYHFYVLSHLYDWVGTNVFWNGKLHFLERVIRRLVPARKYYI